MIGLFGFQFPKATICQKGAAEQRFNMRQKHLAHRFNGH